MAPTLVALTTIVVFEYLFSLLFLRWPREVLVATYASPNAQRTSIVLPGFSNPSSYLGLGMQRILGRYGPMLVLQHATTINFDRIYEAIMTKLSELAGQEAPQKLTIYGHSMGGQIGARFLERYEREGCPYGPVEELFLDCTPGTIRSLPAPTWLKQLLRVVTRVYQGGPILSLLVAIGNYISRITMPAPLSAGADKPLYRHYAHDLMWFNSRAWLAQLRFMLNNKLPNEPSKTSAQVVYIGATDPSKDGLVRQRVSIPEWQQVYPGMLLVLDDAVGHAWPMEQPEAYTQIVRSVIAPT